MALPVRSNLSALNANRQLGMNSSTVGKSLEKLSSGFRINRAADDSSGLAISEKMKAQIKGLEQASSNSQDGISLVQTAEGATTEIHNMLNRMVELATKSSNGTIQNEVDREAIQKEVDDLNSEITRIAQSTNFNGINLLDGSLSGSSSAGAAGKASIDLTKNANLKGALSTIDATKGKYQTEDLATLGAATAVGDRVEFKLNYKDENGNDNTITLNFKAESSTGWVSEQSGKAYTLTARATKVDLANMIKDELKNTAAGDLFDVKTTTGGAALVFEAKTAGANKGQVTGFSIADDTASAGTMVISKSKLATNTAGVDEFDSINFAKLKAWDGTADNLGKADVMTINGEKFMLIGSEVTADQIATLDKDINVIKSTQTSGSAASTNTRAAFLQVISNKTGLKIEAHATLSTGINIKNAPTATNAVSGLTLQVGDTNASFNKVSVSVDDLSAKGIKTAGLKVATQVDAGNAIDTIKQAINKVSTNRANLGSLQNRLEYTINNLNTTAENMTSANSRIRDTDMAKEMMEYTKMNVLVQSAQAMLAQANQTPQSVLQLLQ